ncbi:hypothetical protein G7B40_035840 [Aetokthonos hydrillicola Thurmond2011]|jgi:hypothetical protein|uniref:Uncharacterized protein n=2 Tax=Aetokthonos TaxID=1550243 RepID=A0AAP5IDX9_9CYAN|nr:hypothetical protein [Aetokthonos hydrillicola]MBO3460738.1 hypothetical protein [Aetokthonos hydrillicola CCALA 1050]MBW4586403.1 hypothetical protein [Aetokthonos hydrillicola CCALA 1050]MDR9899890.1 hypothetical protein [Aetokthonos hydrillicola Thurmond2011]
MYQIKKPLKKAEPQVEQDLSDDLPLESELEPVFTPISQTSIFGPPIQTVANSGWEISKLLKELRLDDF